MTPDTDAVPPLDRPTIVAAALAAAVPGALMGLRLNENLWSGGLLNPDSAMRLVRLNDIVASGTPLHAVMRDASGAGNLLPWSHLLDSLLLLLAAPLSGLLGWPTALHLAGMASGPLAMAGLGIAVAWAAAPVASRGWLWMGAFAAGVAPVLGGYGMLGVVHHHVMLALVPVMAAGWALRLLRRAAGRAADASGMASGGMSLGAWTATGLWFSPEALPFALLAVGALWATWFALPTCPSLSTPSSTAHLTRPRLLQALLACSCTFAAVVTLAWAADPPASGWMAVEPDRISLPFVLLALGAAATAGVARITARRVPPLVCGGALALLWLAAFPQFMLGTNGLMTAEEAHAFFKGIKEMQPVTGLDEVFQCLLGGVFAGAALTAFAWRHRATPVVQIPLLYAAAASLALVWLAAQHVRFTVYPASAGAVLLPVVLSAISAGIVAPAIRSLARSAVIVGLVAGPILAPLAAEAGPRRPIDMPCKIAGAIALLASHPGEVVLSGVNQSPELLYGTRALTVGSLYHRNPQATIRLRAAWRAVPGPAPDAAMRATGATLVLGCPHEPRPSVFDDLPKTTLLDRLIADDPPAWLHRLADAGPGGYVLYAVAP